MKLDLSKSEFGMSSERKLHQHNTILSIQEFIIMRTNPLTDHCAKQREAHTSFSCYWPLLKSPLFYFHSYLWLQNAFTLNLFPVLSWDHQLLENNYMYHEHFMEQLCFASNISDHLVVHYGLTKISCYLFEQQLEL